MAQLYQLTGKELAFLDALASERDITSRLIEHGLIGITDTGLALTSAGLDMLEQARAEGALPRPKRG